MGISVKLQNFEGPLDLLLHLIEKNKMNIYDIPIVDITNQYLAIIQDLDRQDLDMMSEFLVMAATLIEIKAKMLLPKEILEDGTEEDPRAELVEQLLEYKMYKYMSYELKDLHMEAERNLYKQPTLPREITEYEEPVDIEVLLNGLTLKSLYKIFKDIMKKQEDKVDPIRSHFGKIETEEVSLPDKIQLIEMYLEQEGFFSFQRLLKGNEGKMELIVTFLAILELMKTGKIQIKQMGIFDEIWIQSAEAS